MRSKRKTWIIALFSMVRSLTRRRLQYLVSLAALAMSQLLSASVVSADVDGWKIVADTGRNLIEISHTAAGVVLSEAQLYANQRRNDLVRWEAHKLDARTIRIETTEPSSQWTFRIESDDTLQLSSDAPGAQLSGNTPCTKDRLVARTIDREGTPVTWQGTEEVHVGYNGPMTQNPSYLPRQNPDVMYFALGPVSGAGFHSLFDRASDNAIDFPATATMSRDKAAANVLHISLPISGETAIRVTRDYYKRLGLPFYAPFDDADFPRPPITWSSWTAYYSQVSESAILDNADWLAKHLKPYGFEYIQLDDGYDRTANGAHTWIGQWDTGKFPDGPKWLTSHIRSEGLHAGIWLVPNAYAGALQDHPDWYVRDKNGNVILDYKTPTLDSTNPQVLAFLKKLFTTLDDWGFDYYKFDGEHAFPKYVPAVDHSKLYNPSIDPVIAYRDRLKLIRDVVGPKVFLELCPAGTPLNGIGFANSYFNGQDVYNSWQGMYALFSSINANAFLNHVVTYLMPGEGIDIAPYMTVEEASRKRNSEFLGVVKSRESKLAGFGTTLPEARTVVSYVALTGVVYPLASIMPELTEERVRLLKMSMPAMPIYPIDLFSRGTDMRWDTFKHATANTYAQTYPDIVDLKVSAPAGEYDVVAVTNWRGTAASKTIDFHQKLGVNGSEFVIFDFWNQKLLGTSKNSLTVNLEPHDTKALLIHPKQNHPQLVGTSRHITGAYSIRELHWNDAGPKTLTGVSETVPGEPYSMTFALAEGIQPRTVAASTSKRKIEAKMQANGQSLTVSFIGQTEPVRWEIRF